MGPNNIPVDIAAKQRIVYLIAYLCGKYFARNEVATILPEPNPVIIAPIVTIIKLVAHASIIILSNLWKHRKTQKYMWFLIKCAEKQTTKTRLNKPNACCYQ